MRNSGSCPCGGASASNHKFCGGLGHTADDSTGLTYMRARYYDPAIGRFISEDPAGNGVNWYAYCGNNPANCDDPSGCFTASDETSSAAEESAVGEGSGSLAVMVKQYIERKMYQALSKYVQGYLAAEVGAGVGEGELAQNSGRMSWIVQTSKQAIEVTIDWSMHKGYEYVHWNFTKANGLAWGGSPNHAPLEAVGEVVKWLGRFM